MNVNNFVATGVIKGAKKVNDNVGTFMMEMDANKPEYRQLVKFTTFKDDVFGYAEQFKDSGDRVSVDFNLSESKHRDTGKHYNPTCKAWRIKKFEEDQAMPDQEYYQGGDDDLIY